MTTQHNALKSSATVALFIIMFALVVLGIIVKSVKLIIKYVPIIFAYVRRKFNQIDTVEIIETVSPKLSNAIKTAVNYTSPISQPTVPQISLVPQSLDEISISVMKGGEWLSKLKNKIS
jgi:hypothetical protein